MHHYAVEFRITGSDLAPASVTAALGLEPTTSWDAGECANPKNPNALWGYNASDREGSDSLEGGLKAVLKVLTPLKDRIEPLKSRYDVFLWCGHFSSSFCGGPSFSPELLSQLADFGVPLYLDTYISEED